MTTTNGGPAPIPGAGLPPQLSVLSQYIKDLSFENPNAPQSLNAGQQNPDIKIQINVDVAPQTDTDIEVMLKLEGRAESGGMLLFAFTLDFGGMFRIQNVPQENMSAVVMIECPRLLFPFAREIVASAVRSGGFPPLLLDPVDFVGLYRQKMAELSPFSEPAIPS